MQLASPHVPTLHYVRASTVEVAVSLMVPEVPAVRQLHLEHLVLVVALAVPEISRIAAVVLVVRLDRVVPAAVAALVPQVSVLAEAVAAVPTTASRAAPERFLHRALAAMAYWEAAAAHQQPTRTATLASMEAAVRAAAALLARPLVLSVVQVALMLTLMQLMDQAVEEVVVVSVPHLEVSERAEPAVFMAAEAVVELEIPAVTVPESSDARAL
jgi:uncharacterized membrane protein YkvI